MTACGATFLWCESQETSSYWWCCPKLYYLNIIASLFPYAFWETIGFKVLPWSFRQLIRPGYEVLAVLSGALSFSKGWNDFHSCFPSLERMATLKARPEGKGRRRSRCRDDFVPWSEQWIRFGFLTLYPHRWRLTFDCQLQYTIFGPELMFVIQWRHRELFFQLRPSGQT